MGEDLTGLGVARLSQLIAAREISPREVVDAYLDRVARLDPLLGAFITVLPDRARSEAEAAEAEIVHGGRRGPLHGMPFAVKDVIDVAGVETTGGSRLLAGNVARADAACIARLRAAGAVLLGKLMTYEMASGGPSFDLPWPPPRNPWHLDHATGGSSSGSAVAVAAGLAPLALGSDTGGSVRVPAAYCGLTGLKPTFGRIDTAGVLPLSPSFDTVGLLCRTAEDCAVALPAIAPATDPVPDHSAGLRAGLRGMRIGLVRDFYADGVGAADAVVTAMDEAAAVFGALGAEIEEASIGSLEDYGACSRIMVLGEAFALHERNLIRQAEAFGEVFRYRVLPGLLVQAADYVAASWLRRTLTEAMSAVLGRVDVLLCPTTLGPAPALESMTLAGRLTPFPTAPFSVAGVPVVSLCNGFAPSGLPVGMQIAGRPNDEGTVLRVAHAYQQATTWHERRPSLGSGWDPATSRTPLWTPAGRAADPALDDYVDARLRISGITLGERARRQLGEAAEVVMTMAGRVRSPGR
jgi:aspartyl-tRNA(Asn)/glutamyl-tRNA(Gln) amidotransferase subunit A